jgi:hypothetical protein
MHISEREVEDLICERPDELYPDLEIIDRQVPLEHGRLDVLAYDGQHVWVIELKAQSLKEQDIGQVLRYTYDVRTELIATGQALIDTGTLPLDHLEPTKQEMFYEFWHHSHEDNRAEVRNRGDVINPVLVGTSIDRKTAIAALQANVSIYLWHYDEEMDWLFIDAAPYIYPSGIPTSPDWARTLNQRLYSECMELADSYYEFKLRELFNLKA